MKKQRVFLGICVAAFMGACWEPPYRYDVRGNGQGGIDIQKVPKEPPAPAPAPAPAAPAPEPIDQNQQIDELQAKVKALSAENQKLKQQLPATVPATNPGKE